MPPPVASRAAIQGPGRCDYPGRHSVRGKSIHEILELTVDSAIIFFRSIEDKKAEKVVMFLEHLTEVGLGYLRLGQPLNTLSGGESQRIKLVGHLLKKRSQKVQKNAKGDLLLFDEPTTGLHFDDINVLLKVFHKLVDHGHSVLVIEHNSEKQCSLKMDKFSFLTFLNPG